MEYGAIDLHKQRSVVRLVAADGSVLVDRRIDTTRAGFASVFGDRAHLRVLLESATESEWVAQYLEELGHEVVVADPSYALMYGARARRIKTDRRDVAALAEACRTGIYRSAYRRAAAARQLRQALRARQHLVRMRTQSINLVRTLLRHEGVRLPSGPTETVAQRVTRVEIPAAVQTVIAPTLDALRTRNATIATCDQQLKQRAVTDPASHRLMSAPGVGPIVALTFQAVVDDPRRFGGDARRLTAYLGPDRPGASRLEHLATTRRSGGALAYLGAGARRASGAPDRDCCARPPACACALRDVAGSARFHRGGLPAGYHRGLSDESKGEANVWGQSARTQLVVHDGRLADSAKPHHPCLILRSDDDSLMATRIED